MIRGFETSTYKEGFPNYKNNTDLNETYIKMMRFIMKRVSLCVDCTMIVHRLLVYSHHADCISC